MGSSTTGDWGNCLTLVRDARCSKGPLTGLRATSIQANARRLKCLPEVMAAQRLFPKLQCRCRSAIVVFSFIAHLHHAIRAPSDNAKCSKILVTVEAMASKILGCRDQLSASCPFEAIKMATDAMMPRIVPSNALRPSQGRRRIGLGCHGLRESTWLYSQVLEVVCFEFCSIYTECKESFFRFFFAGITC